MTTRHLNPRNTTEHRLSCAIRLLSAATFACILAVASLSLTATEGRAQATQQPPQKLDTVRVTTGARTGQVARSITIINREEIQQRPVRTVADVIASELGTDLMKRSAAQSDLSIRGSSFEQVLVLVDGVRTGDQQTGHFDLDLAVPLATVERIEILRGAGSAVYGTDAVGGVVNIITRSNATEQKGVHRELSVHGGTFATQGASGVLAFGSQLRGAIVSLDHERSDGHRPDTDYRITQFRLSATTAAGSGIVRTDIAHGLRDFGAADFYAPYPSHERTTASTAAVVWQPAPAAGWSLDVIGSARRHGDVFTLVRDNPALYQNVHTNWQSTLEITARRRFGDFSAAVGGEGSALWLRSERLGDRDAARGAVFAEGTLAKGRAMANAGLRGDWSSENGAVLSPSLSASFAANRYTTLRASGSHGFRAPSWTDRYYADPASVGNPDLRPEDFWTGEVGLNTQVTGGFGVDVAGWVRNARDLIDWVRPVGSAPDAVWHAMNIGSATFTGLESAIKLPPIEVPVLGALRAGLHYSATKLSSTDAEGWTGRYALRPETRSFLARGEVDLGSNASLAVGAGMAGYAGEESHGRADARLAWSFRVLRITVDALNLTDADYADEVGRPVAGRSLHVGAGWRW